MGKEILKVGDKVKPILEWGDTFGIDYLTITEINHKEEAYKVVVNTDKGDIIIAGMYFHQAVEYKKNKDE